MKKIKRSSELLWLFGVVFVAFGVAICSKADLGVSMIAAPAFVLSEVLQTLWSGFSVGVTEYIFQGFLLLVMCLAVRRFNWRYLLAFAVAIIYGYTLDLFLFLLEGVRIDATWIRWVMLVVGDVIVALGVACFFRTYLPLQVYELFVSEIASHFKLKLTKTKHAFDLSLLVISIVLALLLFRDVVAFDWTTVGHASFHCIGLGTLLTTAINSPLIGLMCRLIDRIFEPTALFPRMEDALKIEK